MELWAIFRQRLQALFRRGRLDRDLEDEMEFHLEMRERKLRSDGAGGDDAHAAARRSFGNPTLVKESARDLWMFRFLEQLGQDLRYALRSMRKSPAAAAVIVLSLAFGIGANTAIFSLMNAVMLRLLPVEKPEELVSVLSHRPGEPPRDGFTNALWEAIRDQQNVFSGAFAFSNSHQFDLGQGGAVRNVNGIFVSGAFFQTLGIAPAAGRLIAPGDDQRGCQPVAVLSYAFWRSHFGQLESALGSSISLERQSFQVIGVAPPGFHGVRVGKDFDVAIPLCSAALFDKRNLGSRSRWWLSIMGRVKEGITPEQLTARLDLLSAPVMQAAVPDWEQAQRQRFLVNRLVAAPAAKGSSELRSTFADPLYVLMAIVAMVLLIACANIAGLLLARASTRGKELAVRRALGAARSRLARQLLTESLLLSLIGAALGVVFAQWSSALLARNLTSGRDPVFLDLALDARVLAFTAAVAVLTGLLVGLLPAIRSTRVGLMEAMTTRAIGGSDQRSRFTLGRWIVAGQVALSLVLLVGGGLLLRTFLNLLTLDMGFDRNNVLVVTVTPPWFAADVVKTPQQQRAPVYDEIGRRLRALPGVASAARAFTTPLGQDNWMNNIVTGQPNAPTGDASTTYFNYVSPGYFATVRMPLLAGRDFTARDTSNSAPVAVVNETLAHQFFPGMDALGKTFRQDRGQTLPSPLIEIVGIVKDSKYQLVREDTLPTAFLPASQSPPESDVALFVLRTSVKPESLIPDVQRAIAAVDAEMPIESHTLAQQVDDGLVQERLLAALSGFFGALALLLAMIGLYGVLSYLVTQRQVEFGIRMALGARRTSILRMVMRDVVIVTAGGIVTGLGIALAGVKVLQSQLYGLGPRDATTIIAAVGLLAAMALLAGYLPARRATLTDPMVALRYE